MVNACRPCWVTRAYWSGCQWGMQIGQLFPPHSSLSSMKWRRTGGVHPRSATFSRDHLCMSLWIAAARPPDFPVATTITARPPPGTHVPPGLFPGVPVTRGHPHGHLGTPHPALAPGPIESITAMQCRRPTVSRQPRTHPLPGWRMSGGTCGVAVDGLVIVGSILHTLPRPSPAIP